MKGELAAPTFSSRVHPLRKTRRVEGPEAGVRRRSRTTGPDRTRGVNSGHAPRQTVMLVGSRTERGSMKNLIQRFIREDEGQDLIEYALLAAFISIVAIAMIIAVGSDVNRYFENVQSVLT